MVNTRNPADRQLVRALNQSMVLNVVREQGPISRAAIARRTGLSQATVGAIVPTLVEQGLVSEGAAPASGVGRPPTLVDLDRDSYNVVGMKLMEDRIVGAVTDLEAGTVAQHEIELSSLDVTQVVNAATEFVADLLTDADLTNEQIFGVGVGLAGVIDAEHGVCRSSPFLGWENVPIASLLEEQLDVPVRVDNDVNTLALAERWFGVGQRSDNFVVVSLGRGVGFSYVSNGSVNRGAHGGAGEFGHTVVGGSDERCPCGNIGCLEAVVGEAALLSRAARVAGTLGAPAPQTASELYRIAETMPEFQALLHDAGTVLGRGIANVVNLFGPDLVIISGEGIEAGDAMLGDLAETIEAHVHSGLRKSYELVVEPLRDEAWARGAASLVLDALFESPMRTTAAHAWQTGGIV